MHSTTTTVLTLALFTTSALAATKPHIVLFIADDFTARDSTPYGSTDARTPHIQALANKGLLFTNAFAPSPTCTPSRSALFTGLYPIRNGAHANHSLVKGGLTTFPQHLQQQGYRVVLAGKTHFGPRDEFPFEYLPKTNILLPGQKHILWSDIDTKPVDTLLKNHDRDKPLCLIVAAHDPHVFWRDNKDFDPAKVTLPPGFVDTPETRLARCKYLTDVANMDRELGDVMTSLDKHHYTDNTLLLFTADQGAQFPFSKWTLYDAGIRTPLIAAWPGHTKPHTKTDALVSLVDLLPTFLDAAGAKPPDSLDGKSFLPVLTDPTKPHAKAVFATNTGDKDMNRAPMRAIRTAKYKYILNLTPEIEFTTHISHAQGADGRDYWDTWVARAKSDPAAKKVIDRYAHHPPEELYDIETDPYELTNLATDPAHAQTLTDLRAQLKQWRQQQGDNLAKPLMPEDSRTGELRYAG